MKLPLFMIAFVMVGLFTASQAQTDPGMGGVFIDQTGGSNPVIPKKVVPGSISVVNIDHCWSMSTIDSTSHQDQNMAVGEVRYLPYIIQNQGNVRDSIVFAASWQGMHTIQPVVALVGTDSQAIGFKTDSVLYYGTWLNPLATETILVKIAVPFENLYARTDSFMFRMEIKNRNGTGCGPDSSDGWPGNRLVYRQAAIYTERGKLTDRTYGTKSQDWMINEFQVAVKTAASPLSQLSANPQTTTMKIYAAETKTEFVSIWYPSYFRTYLRFWLKTDSAQKTACKIFNDLPPLRQMDKATDKEIRPDQEYLPQNLTVEFIADSLIDQTVMQSCSLYCGTAEWGSKLLTTFQLTIEPLEMLSIHQQDQIQVLSSSPNPFKDYTRLSYYLPHPEMVTIRVYDQQGQLIKELLQARRTLGIHRLTWDGKNFNDEPVKNGLYFYEITIGKYQSYQKIILIKK